MIPEHLTGHFTECLSHLVFASIPAGQKTLALIDPTTGKLEQYTLVKVNNCPAEFPAPTVHARSRLSRRTLSEGGLALPREPSALRSRHIRSVRYSEKSLLNISLDMLRKMDDSTWPTHPEPKALIGRSSSPPHRLKMSASFTRFGIPFTADDSNPSLLNESYPPDISSPSPLPNSAPPKWIFPSVNAADEDMTKDNADASMSTLVGLGISGMLKDDGTFFDGLGALPRRSQIDPPGLGLFLSENDGHWAWTHEVLEDMDDTRPGHIWQTDITFARRFDAQLRTMPGTSTPVAPRAAPSKRYSLPCVPVHDDVFLSFPMPSTPLLASSSFAKSRVRRDSPRSLAAIDPLNKSMLWTNCMSPDNEREERNPSWSP